MQTVRPVTKPGKQRKMLYEAADHIRHRLLAAHLSPELRATHLAKSLPVRSGDTVRVMRGDHKGFEGKISRVDLEKYRVFVEGLTREKVDGTTVFLAVHPSKLMVTRLNIDDKWRKKILERKQKAQKQRREVPEKPKAEVLEKAPEAAELKEPSEEKAVAVEKPTKPKAARRTRKAKETAGKPAEESEKEKKPAEAEEKKRGRKPRAERRPTQRRRSKKTVEGEE